MDFFSQFFPNVLFVIIVSFLIFYYLFVTVRPASLLLIKKVELINVFIVLLSVITAYSAGKNLFYNEYYQGSVLDEKHAVTFYEDTVRRFQYLECESSSGLDFKICGKLKQLSDVADSEKFPSLPDVYIFNRDYVPMLPSVKNEVVTNALKQFKSGFDLVKLRQSKVNEYKEKLKPENWEVNFIKFTIYFFAVYFSLMLVMKYR
ncbi:hypothetical protein L4C36_22755, partial [Photobacterium japonica]|uniref:hypothetical protein n=1 Tax=Photobacterium japonica TaxID=2910235 RepID=UPI003D0CD687